MPELLKEFESVENENVEFPDNESDKNIKDAEIISETRNELEAKEEVLDDKLTQLLSNLPENAETKFIITRLADKNLAGKFRIPSNSIEECDAIYWNGDTEPSAIYAEIKRLYGGGIYRIRTHANGQFIKNGTWTITLSDPPQYSEKEKLLREEKTKTEEQPRNTQISQSFANTEQPAQTQNQLSGMREFMQTYKEIKEFENTLKPETGEKEQVPQSLITAETIKLEVLKMALADPEIKKMAMMSFFKISPEAEGNLPPEEKSFWSEAFSFVISHPEETKAVAQTLFSSFGSLIAPIASRLAPAQPAQNIPAQNFSLEMLRNQGNDVAPAPMTQTQPEATQSAKAPVLAIQLNPEIEKIPFVEIED